MILLYCLPLIERSSEISGAELTS